MKRFIAIILCLVTAFGAVGADASRPAVTVVADRPSKNDPMLKNAVRVRSVRKADGVEITQWGSGGCAELTEFGMLGNRYIITAAHVILDDDGNVEERVEAEILLQGAEVRAWLQVEVMFYDKELDIAVLKSPVEMASSARLADDDSLKNGDEVTAIGGPMGQPLQASKGTIVKNSPWRCENIGTMNIRHGNSGGPVFDSEGHIVAIVRAFQRVGRDEDGGPGVMVPIECVRKYINSKVKK
jgi:S1-C subfamily serine protease